MTRTQTLERSLGAMAHPLQTPAHLDPLLDLVGDAKFVLLGEASHGTSEYYTWRTALTRRLVAEKGFSVVAVEGDWPDCRRIHRYLREGAQRPVLAGAREVLHAFARWPTWMWANREVVRLVEWMREWSTQPDNVPLSFYGLDIYSLWESMTEIVSYLRRSSPESLPAAIAAFECFGATSSNAEAYAWRTRWLREDCESEVVRLLTEIRQRACGSAEDRFDAEQNALVLKNAEAYYRTMVRGGPDSWNVRDSHMTDTLERIAEHHGREARVIVWAHNTHVGDARFTDMAEDGMVNVGQLLRERRGIEVVLVGFGSYVGSVIAGRQWDAPMERMGVPPAREGSWEELLHLAVGSDRLLILSGMDEPALLKPRGHRAIGVVYHPEREAGNYVPTVLPRRYDAFVYLDRTEALHPLREVLPLEEGEMPETWPTGM